MVAVSQLFPWRGDGSQVLPPPYPEWGMDQRFSPGWGMDHRSLPWIGAGLQVLPWRGLYPSSFIRRADLWKFLESCRDRKYAKAKITILCYLLYAAEYIFGQPYPHFETEMTPPITCSFRWHGYVSKSDALSSNLLNLKCRTQEGKNKFQSLLTQSQYSVSISQRTT